MKMRILSLFAALVLAATPALALQFQPVVHMDVRGGYAAKVGDPGSAMVLGSMFVVPAMSFSDSLSLVPSLYANASGRERSIQEDTLFIRSFVFGFRPSLKMTQSPSSSSSLRLDVRRSMNVEAVNEPLGKGLYDFDEFSAGIGWDGLAADVPVGIGLDANRRGYPNYKRQGAELTQGLNERVKDFSGFKGSVKATFEVLGQVSASLQWKTYDDSYVVRALDKDGDGTVNLGLKQADLYSSLALDGGTRLNKAWGLGWGLQWTMNSSNQNTFDAARNTKLPSSQDYQTLGGNTGLQWAGTSWKAGVGYSATLRLLNRPVQDVGGAYTAAKINDIEHGLNLSLGHKLGLGFSWVNGAALRMVSSNQLYQAGGDPNYSFYSVNTGFEWDGFGK